MDKDTRLGNCPKCGKNMDMVGKAHDCRPPRGFPATAIMSGAVLSTGGTLPPRKGKLTAPLRDADTEVRPKRKSPPKPAVPSKLAAVAARLKGRGALKGRLQVGVDLGKPIYEQVTFTEQDGPYFRDGKQVAPAVGASLPADDKIDTSDIPEATEEDFKRGKVRRLKPRSHPDCERCNTDRAAAAERMRKRRAPQ